MIFSSNAGTNYYYDPDKISTGRFRRCFAPECVGHRLARWCIFKNASAVAVFCLRLGVWD